MFDHVKFGVSDSAASKAFFLKATRTTRRDRRLGGSADLRCRA